MEGEKMKEGGRRMEKGEKMEEGGRRKEGMGGGEG